MKQGIVTARLLNFRQTPGGAVIDVLEAGEKLEVLRSAGSWFQVKVESAIGYVSSRYVQVMPAIRTPRPEDDDTNAPAQAKRMGTVTTDRLNFRDAPNGHILKALPRGSSVQMLNQVGGWIEVLYQGKKGYLSGQYVRPDSTITEEPSEPDVTENSGFRYDDKKAITPDGTVFGKKFRKGLYNYGKTSIADFIAQSADQITDISASRLRVMDAVSENEGKFEAVNTWDNAHLSIGLFQWTAGVGADAGELAPLLERFRQDFSDEYEEFFGRYGLIPTNLSHVPGNVARGYLSLNGVTLTTGEQKEVLRKPFWAHQCWLAGHGTAFQTTQLAHAVSRIDVFYAQDKRKIRGRWVQDYISSEHGVAQLLDQHVNRPAHVPLTLSQALEDLSDQLDIDNPQNWGDAEEQKLIEHYLVKRERTSMTDSTKRANTIKKNIAAGRVSDKRFSFT